MSIGIILHHFFGQGHPWIQGAMTADDLTQFIEAIGPENLLHPEEWIAAREAAPLGEPQVCLTFDDALRSQIDIATPVLKDFGIKAFFFVYSSIFEGKIEEFEVYRYFKNLYYDHVHDFYPDFYEAVGQVTGRTDIQTLIATDAAAAWLSQYSFYTLEDRQFRYIRDRILTKAEYDAAMVVVIERKGASIRELAQGIWMNDDDVRNLIKDGHVIGLHSHTHPTNMDRLGRATQQEEYDRNLAHLTQLLGHKPDTMAHPSGSYTEETLEILRERGIKIGFRSDEDIGGGTLLELPRLDYKLTPYWHQLEIARQKTARETEHAAIRIS